MHTFGRDDDAGGVEGVDDAADTVLGPAVGVGAFVQGDGGVEHPRPGGFTHVDEDGADLPDEARGLEAEAGQGIAGSDEFERGLVAGRGQGSPFLVEEVGQGEARAGGDFPNEAQDGAGTVEPHAVRGGFPGGQVGLGGVEVGGEASQGRAHLGGRVDFFAHGTVGGVPPAPLLVLLEVLEEVGGPGVPGHEGGCGSADHRGLSALGQDGAGHGDRAGFGGGDDLGVPAAVGGAQRTGQGGEAVGHKVGRALDSAHLRECEHVGHARADACVEGTSEVDLTVGAQEGVANPGFRPGREGNKRVEVGVEGAA